MLKQLHCVCLLHILFGIIPLTYFEIFVSTWPVEKAIYNFIVHVYSDKGIFYAIFYYILYPDNDKANKQMVSGFDE